jgi:hypothetical protein
VEHDRGDPAGFEGQGRLNVMRGESVSWKMQGLIAIVIRSFHSHVAIHVDPATDLMEERALSLSRRVVPLFDEAQELTSTIISAMIKKPSLPRAGL